MGESTLLIALGGAPEPVENPEPVEMRVIERLEDLRVIAHPLRVRIIGCLGDQELTVRELQKKLGINSTRLYYHVSELERAGFIRLVRTEIQSGIQLKYYRSSARYFYLSPALLHGNRDEVDASGDYMVSLLETSARNLRKSFSSGLVDRFEDAFKVSLRQNRMSRKRATQFLRQVEELDKEFEGANDPEGEVSVEFAVALFPR